MRPALNIMNASKTTIELKRSGNMYFVMYESMTTHIYKPISRIEQRNVPIQWVILTHSDE